MDAEGLSEQLPCRSADVKFFSVFLCQRCREIWREILVKISALRFPGFGCATETFQQNGPAEVQCEFFSPNSEVNFLM